MIIFGEPWPYNWPWTSQPNFVVNSNPWQKCPVCDGTGLVSRPPGVAGDQQTWADTQAASYECRSCLGKGMVR